MFVTILLLVIVTLIVHSIYRWITLNDDYFVRRNIAHLKPTFLLGNTGRFYLKQVRTNEFYQNLYNSFPNEKIFGIFDFRRPMFVVRDPEMLRQMTIKDFDHFEDHNVFADDVHDTLLGNSLVLLRGTKWRDMRATLSPAFTGSKMRLMFELVDDCAFDMCAYFKKQLHTGIDTNFEMKEIFSRYTNDVIATSAFGITVNSFENKQNEFYLAGKRMLNLGNLRTAVKMIGTKLVPRLMRALDIQIIDSSAGKFFRNLVLDTIEVRDKQKIFRPDMIDRMMQLKKGGAALAAPPPLEEKDNDGFATVKESNIGQIPVHRQWNDDEIVAQCFIFFVAGFDSSATLLSFAAYELAKNPEIQDQLYAEIRNVNEQSKGHRLTYDVLQKMKYMDMVISETLRIWSPAPFTDRVCVKDYAYNDGGQSFVIEKGTVFWVPIYGLHRDGKYFPNPDRFDPERFSDARKDSIAQGSYLPFGIGPRNCIGSRFALMEAKALMYYLLLNFKFLTSSKTQIPLRFQKNPVGMFAEKGIHLQMELR